MELAVALLRELGIKHLRTGISWADFHRPEGKAWYDWQMKALADAGLHVLISIWHTPPSLAQGGVCAGPPRRLEDYADFVGQVIREYGESFQELELWNEPNNLYKWDFQRFDPRWRKFGEMTRVAAQRARQRGKTTVLGGMIPVDRQWLELMKRYGTLKHIDVVAIHAFPGMWWDEAPDWDQLHSWQGWDQKIDHIAGKAGARPIWVTETGLATWDMAAQQPGRFESQVERLEAAVTAPTPRLYWYSLIDLHPERSAIEGFHVDENEYHMGLVTHTGARKPAFETLRRLLGGHRRSSTASELQLRTK